MRCSRSPTAWSTFERRLCRRNSYVPGRHTHAGMKMWSTMGVRRGAGNVDDRTGTPQSVAQLDVGADRYPALLPLSTESKLASAILLRFPRRHAPRRTSMDQLIERVAGLDVHRD